MRSFKPSIRQSSNVLLLDNYDSFTFNVVQSLLQLGAAVSVYRNDEDVNAWLESAFSHLIISPGPGGPDQTGNAAELVKKCAGNIPVLGICLGHQLLATIFGGRVGRVKPVHGKCDTISHHDLGLHRGLPADFNAARYHSLAVLETGDELEVTATGGEEKLIMGLRHRQLPLVEGVQYHPESFMTPVGIDLFRNFLAGRLDRSGH